MNNTLKTKRIDDSRILPLFRHYDGQILPQRAYLEIDHSRETISLDYDETIGGGMSERAFNGYLTHITVPNNLTTAGCEQLLEDPVVLKYCEDIQAQWSEIYDGQRYRGRFNDDYESYCYIADLEAYINNEEYDSLTTS